MHLPLLGASASGRGLGVIPPVFRQAAYLPHAPSSDTFNWTSGGGVTPLYGNTIFIYFATWGGNRVTALNDTQGNIYTLIRGHDDQPSADGQTLTSCVYQCDNFIASAGSAGFSWSNSNPGFDEGYVYAVEVSPCVVDSSIYNNVTFPTSGEVSGGTLTVDSPALLLNFNAYMDGSGSFCTLSQASGWTERSNNSDLGLVGGGNSMQSKIILAAGTYDTRVAATGNATPGAMTGLALKTLAPVIIQTLLFEHAPGNDSAGFSSPNVTPTVGNSLWIFFNSWDDNDVSNVTDDAGNVYTQIGGPYTDPTAGGTHNSKLSIWKCTSIVGTVTSISWDTSNIGFDWGVAMIIETSPAKDVGTLFNTVTFALNTDEGGGSISTSTPTLLLSFSSLVQEVGIPSDFGPGTGWAFVVQSGSIGNGSRHALEFLATQVSGNYEAVIQLAAVNDGSVFNGTMVTLALKCK